MHRLEKLVPLIGPTVMGPLGIIHLPRMWLKGVLSAAGALYAGYYDDYKGFNARVIDGLGLEPDPWFAFLATMPTYPEAERYVTANATRLDPASIAALNAEILAVDRPEENAGPLRARTGLDDPSLRRSARLIDFDDWHTMHRDIVAARGAGIEPIVPMVSSIQTGQLNVPHLPRMWFKALLAAAGALPPGWKTGANCGFDSKISELIGLDVVEACTFIGTDFPDEVQFERWVGERIARPDADATANLMSTVQALEKAPEAAAADLVEAGAPGLSVRGTILLNDMVDWQHMHDDIVARRATHA